MQKLSLRLLANVIFITIAPSVHANINNIKGTYDILKPKYKHLSVIHGAVAEKTGTIRRMFDLGALGEKHDSKIKSSTIALAHKIFHREENTSGAAEFVLTKAISAKEITNEDLALFVADVMIYLEKLPEQDIFKKYQQTEQTYKTLHLTYETLTTAPRTNESIDQRKKVSTDLAGLTHPRVTYYKELLDQAEKTLTNYAEPLKTLVPFIIKAYLECAVEEYMPASTPGLILLGMLYKKTDFERDDLEIYYQRLQKEFDCLNEPLDWVAWKSSVFQITTLESMENELKETPPTNDTIQDNYEKIAYVALSPRKYPPVIAYSNTTTIKKDSLETIFPDCMENTVRNIINMLCYQQLLGFDTDLLEKRLNTKVSEKLKLFYLKNKNSISAGEQAVHDDWAQMVISDIPFVSYNNALPEKKKSSNLGFIKINTPLTSELTKFLKEKKYTLLNDRSLAYELNPSLKNLIIVLDYLLGLNLFKGNLTKEFIREDFVQTYLPQCIDKIKASLPKTFTLEDIDKYDYTKKAIRLPIHFSFESPEKYEAELTIKTTSGHGEFFFDKEDEKLPYLFSTLASLNKCPISSLLLVGPSSPLIDMLEPDAYYLWIFSEPADNPLWLNEIKNKNIPAKKNILDLLIFIARDNRSEDEIMRATLTLYRTVLKNNTVEDALISEAIDVAEDGKDFNNPYIQDLALSLFRDLIKKNLGINKILKIAQDGTKSDDVNTQEFSLRIFIKLVSEEKNIKQAIAAAQNALTSKKLIVKREALFLFDTLARKGYALEEATKAGSTYASSKNVHLKELAEELLETVQKSRNTTPTTEPSNSRPQSPFPLPPVTTP